MGACQSCAHENSADARFCSACGSELAEKPGAAREERKTVTVLFADLVGSTARAEQLDPEDVRALLAPYHERLRSELERFGGTVEKFIGDAVMGLFGAPVAHEDDAERAVRAALAIRDWVLEEKNLQLRIALNTGEALVSLDARPAAGEPMASGDVVNSAARLQTAAPVNGILVGEATYRATRHVIDYLAPIAVTAKGKADPIEAREAIAPRSTLGVDVVQTGGTPLIGRQQELALLLSTAQRVLEEREPQLVTLVGVPGIGKSRLTFELFSVLTADDELVWRQGRCLPYGDGVAFWAIGEIVKAHAEIFESDPAERAEQKLLRAIAAVSSDDAERDWLARDLRPLVGLGTEVVAHSREAQADTFAAWRRFFEGLADRCPLVLVFEDLHWAEEQLLDFVDYLVEWAVDLPLLVVCTARPELLERRPGWGGGKSNATTLSLRPLSADDTARLLAASLDRTVLDAQLQTALIERAGGNPLYAEQYARMLAEQPESSRLAVPETVQAIVAARLDSLPDEEKALLHDASVHGKVFWTGAVAAMSGIEPAAADQRLHALERKEFVRSQRRSAVAGESEFAFRHMLVRDVAYSQIPRRVRAEKHRLAAEWIEGLVDDRDDHVELLADHYLHALELLRAVGDDPGSLAVRARVALREAGERAFRLGAFAASARLRRQALELWPADDDRPYVLLELAESLEVSEEAGTKEAEEARDLLLALGDFERAALAEAILYAVGPVAEQEAHIERALALVRDVPDTAIKAAVLSNVVFYWTLRGRIEPALSLAAEVHRIALATGQPDEITNALNALGTARIDNGDLRGVDDLERALTLARESHSPFVAVVAGNLAASLFDLGRLERAFELIAEMRAEATRVGSSQLIEWADVLSMREHYWKGDWDDALRIADARGESGNPRVLTVRSQILLARGDADGALEDSARSVQMGRESGHVQMLHSTLAVHTRVCVAVGDMTEARAPFAELLERFAKERSQQVSASLPDLAIAAVDLGLTDEFTQALGALDQAMPWVGAARAFAHQDYAAAADVYGRIGSRPDAAYARLRHAMALGRGAEADRGLQEALVFFRSVGAKRYVGEAENVLAATA